MEITPVDSFKMPVWFGNEAFHSSHRAALLYKNEDYYRQFNWEELPKYEYIWPVRKITGLQQYL